MTSTTTQDRVRRAIAATAEQIAAGTVPPLRLPPASAGRRQRTVGRPRPVWLAPAAAAVSVAVIATAALIISNGVASRPHLTSPSGVSVPPYYIAITKPRDDAAIYATRTGSLIARVMAPGHNGWFLADTAAADDRTFAIAVSEEAHGDPGIPPDRFYLVKFSPVTRAAQITPIPGLRTPRNAHFAGLALSPSGTKLAIGYIISAGPKYTAVLKVMDLATGAIRTWTSSRGEILSSGGNPSDLSWANDNTTLAFNWYGFTLTPARELRTSGLWLLDTAGPGGDLLADSRRALATEPGTPSFAVKGGYLAGNLVLAPDGKTIVAAITSKPLATSGYVWFATYNAATGSLERIFDRTLVSRTSRSPDMTVLWTSPFSNLLVVHEPPGFKGQLGVLRRSGHVTVLPTSQDEIVLPGPAW